jgi:hypothetical protein
MIRALRQRHRRTVTILGIFMPVIFTLCIAARKPVPLVESLPEALALPSPRFMVTDWERADLFSETSIRVRLQRASVGNYLALSFSAPEDFLNPDLIVYWIPGNSTVADRLPENAELLGAFSSNLLSLQPHFARGRGVLVLYSLANHEIVAISKRFQIP